MDKPEHTILQELLEDPRFADWALGLAPELDEYWEAWIGGSQERRYQVEEARKLLVNFQGPVPRYDDAQIEARILSAMAEAMHRETGERPPGRLSFPGRYRNLAAAVLAVFFAFAVGWIAYENTRHRPVRLGENLPDSVRIHTSGRETKLVQLPDSSTVLLRGGSRLVYSRTFEGAFREVWLEGEAFFEVVKNPEVPFLVHTRKITARVLGTSFRVNAAPGDTAVWVAVKTGRVAIFETSRHPAGKQQPEKFDQKAALKILNAQERMLFTRQPASDRAVPDTLPAFPALPIETMTFEYTATPVQEVFNDLQKAYAVPIRFNPEEVKNCTLTAHLYDEPLQTKLKWICTILEASYTQDDRGISFHTKACN